MKVPDLNLPISKYIRAGFDNYDPAKPDAPANYSLPPTPFSYVVKPDGN